MRDLDAHSWVEAYFRGIGWVTFDPTPAAAPAGSQSQHGELAGTRGPAPDPQLDPSSVKGGSDQSSRGPTSRRAPAQAAACPGSRSGWCCALALAGCVIGVVVVNRRRRALAAGQLVDEQVSELRRALERLGWKLEPNVTLLGLEHRYSAAGRGPLRRYLRMLREHRYAAETTPPPGPADRRALRSAISSGSLRRRLQGLLVIPPGGPSTRR